MIRYTEEQKAQAIASMQEKGVAKTKEEMGISIQTLYKWRNGGAAPKAEGKKRTRKASAKAVAALLRDDGAVEKIAQLETENLKLRTQNDKLRKALQAFLD